MKHFKFSISLLLTILMMACGGSSQNEQTQEQAPKTDDQIQDELYQNVIEIHDEAMLKMETIMRLKNEAIKEVDSLREVDSVANADRMATLEDMQIELESANKGMMMWMRQFRAPADTVAHKEAMKYLKDQESKIVEVDDDMTAAIEKAQSL